MQEVAALESGEFLRSMSDFKPGEFIRTCLSALRVAHCRRFFISLLKRAVTCERRLAFESGDEKHPAVCQGVERILFFSFDLRRAVLPVPGGRHISQQWIFMCSFLLTRKVISGFLNRKG